jgi:hypothetical protein
MNFVRSAKAPDSARGIDQALTKNVEPALGCLPVESSPGNIEMGPRYVTGRADVSGIGGVTEGVPQGGSAEERSVHGFKTMIEKCHSSAEAKLEDYPVRERCSFWLYENK